MAHTRGGNSGNLAHDIPQYKLWQILFMFAWPAVWFSFLIYIVGRQFIPEGGVTPTWVMLAVIVLGAGAEMAVGLVLLKREGYALTLAALRDRIRWKWPKGRQAWLIALGVLVAGMALSMMMGGAIRALPVPDGLPGNGCIWARLTSQIALQECVQLFEAMTYEVAEAGDDSLDTTLFEKTKSFLDSTRNNTN